MAVLTQVSEREARAFTQAYELGALRCVVGVPAGSVNSNFALELELGRFFLRIYEEQDAAGARAEALLLTHLAAAGVPTPPPVARRDGPLIGELAAKPAAIFPWREGTMRCQKSVSASDARYLGAALAAVHRAGEGVLHPAGRFRFDDLRARLPRIAGAKDRALAAEAAPLARKLDEIEGARDRTLPQGLIHGDLFRDNVLWNDHRISALLDFESASHGVLAYDLMVSVLAWCFGDTLDLDLFAAMVEGYDSVRALTQSERAGLAAEGRAAAVRFTITRITDYAMRVTEGPRIIKDWRRFANRLAALEALDAGAWRKVCGGAVANG